MIDKEIAVEVLQDVIDNAKTEGRVVGLCRELKRGGALRYCCSLHPYFRKWPEFSGMVDFPINAQTKQFDCPVDVYLRTVKMYDGRYGQARIRLAKFLLKEFKRELREKRNATACD